MSYPKKLYIKAIAIIFLIGILFLITTGVSGYFALNDTAKYGAITLVLIGFFFYPLMKRLIDSVDAKIIGPIIDEKKEDARKAKMGFMGEDEVFNWLKEVVNPENVLRNIPFNDSLGNPFDIDLLVIDEHGILAFEVKNLSDPVRFENDEYYQDRGGKLISLPPENDPRFETKKHSYVLRKYLDKNGFDSVKIKKALVFVNGGVSWDGNNEMYIVKDKNSLQNYINSLEVDSACTPEICKKIKNLLRN